MKSLRSPEARSVAAVIRRLREEEGLTQRQLADRLQCEQSIISSIETDQRQVDVPEFIFIVEAMGRDATEAFQMVIEERLRSR